MNNYIFCKNRTSLCNQLIKYCKNKQNSNSYECKDTKAIRQNYCSNINSICKNDIYSKKSNFK